MLSMIQTEKCPEKFKATANGSWESWSERLVTLELDNREIKLDLRSLCLQPLCQDIPKPRSRILSFFCLSESSNNGNVSDATLSQGHTAIDVLDILSHLQALGCALRPTTTAKTEWLKGRKSGSLRGDQERTHPTAVKEHFKLPHHSFILLFGHLAPNVHSPSHWIKIVTYKMVVEVWFIPSARLL